MNICKTVVVGLLVAALGARAMGGEPGGRAEISVLVVDGVNNHDWRRATQILKTILLESGLFSVDVSTSPAADAKGRRINNLPVSEGDSPIFPAGKSGQSPSYSSVGPKTESWSRWRPKFEQYDVVVSNFNGGHKKDSLHWPREVERALEDYVKTGGGLVIFHSANNSFLNWTAYNEMIGLGWRNKEFGPTLVVDRQERVVRVPQGQGRNPGHGPDHDFQITVLDREHAITKGLPTRWMHPCEQLSHGQHGPARNVRVLTYAYSRDTQENEVVDWVVPYGKGRVYTSMQGHLWKDGPDVNLRCVGFQTVFIRGVQWAATGEATYALPGDFPTATEIRVRHVPHPPSAVVGNLVIEPQRISIGDGDNWPITWGDDGEQYTVYCDGKGFGGGSGDGSMCQAKVIGSPPRFSGSNIASASGRKTGGGPQGRKASGLLMADGVLYMWVRNLKKDGTGSSLAWSEDKAKTWTWAPWSFPEIGYPVWLNAGRDYQAARDEYAYFYSPDTPSAYQTSDHMLMGRVHKEQISERDAYEFFAGLGDGGRPRWTADLGKRTPVFTDPGHCYRPEVVYNPAIERYLLCTATSGAPKWCGTDEKYLGIFDAPTPWGPWTAVKRVDGWGGEENRFQPRIPSKWIADDGKSFYLLYSCFPKGPYKFNVQKCLVETAAEAASGQ